MTKNELRQKYKQLRSNINSDIIEDDSLAIANIALSLPIWDYTYFHVFLTIEEQKEVNTEYLFHILSGKDKAIVISKSDFETNTMSHYLLTDHTKLAKNKYNIPEPIDGIEVPTNKIQVVFVPLLAYDTKGNRVGYGKGFYDKFLSECDAHVIKIGLSFFDPEIHISDANSTDIALDYVITPRKIHRFI
jgi:5-formyltetrahydrofolate cyclo-ligase